MAAVRAGVRRHAARHAAEEKRREHYRAQVANRALTRKADDRARLEELKGSLPAAMAEAFGDMFREFDVDGNGILTRAELVDCLGNLGVHPTEDELTEWLSVVDDQYSALGIAIDADEWMALMAMLLQPPFDAAELRAMLGHFVALQREQDRAELARLEGIVAAAGVGGTPGGQPAAGTGGGGGGGAKWAARAAQSNAQAVDSAATAGAAAAEVSARLAAPEGRVHLAHLQRMMQLALDVDATEAGSGQGVAPGRGQRRAADKKRSGAGATGPGGSAAQAAAGHQPGGYVLGGAQLRAFLEQLTEIAGAVDACGFAETEAIVQRLLAPSNELAAFGLQASPSPRRRSLFRGVAAKDGDHPAAVGASAAASAAGLRTPAAARAPQASI
jgi:hypothetical protein